MSKRGPCIARLAQQAGGAEPNKEVQATRANTDKRYKRAIKYDDADKNCYHSEGIWFEKHWQKVMNS